MKKLFFILIFTFFSSGNAIALSCSDMKVDPKISVTYSFGKLSYDKTKDVKEITKMANEFNLAESDMFAEGLAVANVSFDISVKTTASPTGIGEFCVIPEQVDVFIGLTKPVIYLANSLKENTCKYNIVLRHEKTHQQINKTTMEYYLPIFKAAVIKIIQNASAQRIENTNQLKEATENLSNHYNKKIMPLVEFIKKEISQEQQKLDNKANYKYEHSLCQDN